jgi:hypothetical protein
MSDSQLTHRTQPGECPTGTPTLLALPCSIYNSLNQQQLNQVNAIQLEYARDSSILQSRAYDAILAIVRDGRG